MRKSGGLQIIAVMCKPFNSLGTGTEAGVAELGVLTYTESVPHRSGCFYIFINDLVY